MCGWADQHSPDPLSGEVEPPSRNSARARPGTRTSERSELLRPFPAHLVSFLGDRSSDPLGPSSSRSIGGGSSLGSVWSHLVAQPVRTYTGITDPHELARSRGARTPPALTGVHLVINQGAFQGGSLWYAQVTETAIGRVTHANISGVTLLKALTRGIGTSPLVRAFDLCPDCGGACVDAHNPLRPPPRPRSRSAAARQVWPPSAFAPRGRDP